MKMQCITLSICVRYQYNDFIYIVDILGELIYTFQIEYSSNKKLIRRKVENFYGKKAITLYFNNFQISSERRIS